MNFSEIGKIAIECNSETLSAAGEQKWGFFGEMRRFQGFFAICTKFWMHYQQNLVSKRLKIYEFEKMRWNTKKMSQVLSEIKHNSK